MPSTSSQFHRPKLFHPFLCRLSSTKSNEANAPQSLVGAGFSSLVLGVLSIFRGSPCIMYYLLDKFRRSNPEIKLYLNLGFYGIMTWMGILYLVMIGLGGLLLFSMKIKRPGILILHPWGLLLLYLDVFIWMSVGTLIFICLEDNTIVMKKPVGHPQVYVIMTFVESSIFFFIYYVYATYFIVVELTVIETFYNRENYENA